MKKNGLNEGWRNSKETKRMKKKSYLNGQNERKKEEETRGNKY